MNKLYIVATPIGNLEDMTIRAQRVLGEVDLIAAEDTRHTGRLLKHLNIDTPLFAYHDHNESEATRQLLAKLKSGLSVALVSDAGTPLISDPGYALVCAARDLSIEVIAVPGASALIAALSVSGLPSDRFVFCGFPPAKEKARNEFLAALREETGTIILYESPHRIVKTMQAAEVQFGAGRQCCIARELTKNFEQVASGTIADMNTALADGGIKVRGEFVLLFHGAPQSRLSFDGGEVLTLLLEDLPPSRAADIASRLTGMPRKALYKIALSLKNSSK